MAFSYCGLRSHSKALFPSRLLIWRAWSTQRDGNKALEWLLQDWAPATRRRKGSLAPTRARAAAKCGSQRYRLSRVRCCCCNVCALNLAAEDNVGCCRPCTASDPSFDQQCTDCFASG